MSHGRLKIKTNSAFETEKIARLLGEEIAKGESPQPIIVALEGDLGAGKTTFVKGLAKGLGIEEKVISPTFILINKYQIPNTRYKILNTFYHIDPYRLKDAKKILPELEELFSEKNAVIAIEWGEKFKEWLPKDTIWIKLTHKGKDKREIKIENIIFPTIVKKVICF